jgi:acylglycerol lipase
MLSGGGEGGGAMNHQIRELTASDGTKLAYHWWPVATPIATVGLLPGMAGHASQPGFEYLVQALTRAGISAAGLDLRGRGRSGGIRGHVDAWSEYISDVDLFLQLIVKEEPSSPVFLFGHSMGGLLALDAAMQPGVALAGVIACSPTLAMREVPPEVAEQVAELDRTAPTTTIPFVWVASSLTRDPAVQQAQEQDPLLLHAITARAAAEMARAIPRVQDRAAEFTLPLLLVYGTDDLLVPPSGSLDFFDRAGMSDRTMLRYEGSRHQPFADLDRDRVNSDIVDWITDHCSR